MKYVFRKEDGSGRAIRAMAREVDAETEIRTIRKDPDAIRSATLPRSIFAQFQAFVQTSGDRS